MIYVVMPHFLIDDEIVSLALSAIKSFRENSDAKIISIDDGGEYCNRKDILLPVSDVYIENEKNLGFAKSCNKGFRWIFDNTKDDCFIICANNDIEINKNVIPALIEPFERFDNVAITGIVSFKSKNPDEIPIEKYYKGIMTSGGLLGDRMQDGGLWCSKKSVLNKIGIFDEMFVRGGYEDVDLFLRARDVYNMKIVMSGRAAYYHKQGATRWKNVVGGKLNNFGIENKRIEEENLKKFIKKWGFNPHTRQIWFSEEVYRD